LYSTYPILTLEVQVKRLSHELIAMSNLIDRLGKKIRAEYPKISGTTLDELQNYRISQKDALSFVFNKLCSYSKKVNTSSIVTYRLKRFESIIGKLKRIEKLNLSGMWDIGGCRCILNNNASVYKLVDLLSKDIDIKIKPRISDYVKAPKEDGYRSVHLYVGLINSKHIVEIQLRNQRDHNWATLVEITDLLFKTRLKENVFHKDFSVFHKHLANLDLLSLSEKRDIAKIIDKHKYFDKLCEVFTRNNIPVRKQWLESKSKGGSYFLIATSEDGQTNLQSFPNFILAEETYFDTYKKSTRANMVLTHLPKPNYDDLSIAYSNYILTYHTFLDDFYQILENLIIEAIENKKYFVFRKHWKLYNNIAINHIYNLLVELKELRNENVSSSKKVKLRGREGEWYNHINRKFEKLKTRGEEFNRQLKRKLPTSLFWNYLFMRTRRRIVKNYYKRLNKIAAHL
jgi:ppGpp synthetase/RelA/SpoT-type nucleotidyltranferase